ncbi:MAG: TetR/AcrR family transcriptional regulator [Bacteriovoracia bacterium]
MDSTKKKRKKNTRGLIIKTALECFSKDGVANTTVSSIATKAKIPHTLILYHFPNMESLYYEAILLLLNNINKFSLAAIEKKIKSPRKALDAYALAYFEWLKRYPNEASIWVFFYSLTVGSPKFRHLNDNIREEGRNRISNLLFEAIAKKEISQTQVDKVPDLAYDIQSTITGTCILACTESKLSIERASKSCLRQISLILSK